MVSVLKPGSNLYKTGFLVQNWGLKLKSGSILKPSFETKTGYGFETRVFKT